MFCNTFDGFKNYQTLLQYVNSPWESNPLLYKGMNYPFGDVIFFTDNTPILALVLKLISNHIAPLGASVIAIYNWLLILGISVTSFFIYQLTRIFQIPVILGVFFALALPWLSPQLLRLSVGHMNLSCMWIIPAVLVLLSKIHKSLAENSLKQQIIPFSWLILLLIATAFIHIYYLAILGAFIGVFFVFHALYYSFLIKKIKIKSLVLGVASIGLAFGIVLLILQVSDPFTGMRATAAQGYNWRPWRLELADLFQPHNWMSLKYKLVIRQEKHYENAAFIGNAAMSLLLGCTILVIVYLSKKNNFRKFFTLSFNKIFYISLLSAMLVGIFMALGQKIEISQIGLKMANIFSPFWYALKFTDYPKQFRCLARFAWPSFWIINLTLLALSVYLLKALNLKRLYKIFFILPVGLLMLDTINAMQHISNGKKDNNLLQIQNKELALLVSEINPTNFQAIISFPFYHVGSEDYHYTIDPSPDELHTSITQVAITLELPVINSKMSRTPVHHVKQYFNFIEGKPNTNLPYKSLKPLLVLVNKTSLENQNRKIPKLEPGATIARDGFQLFQNQYNLHLIAESENYACYKLSLQ